MEKQKSQSHHKTVQLALFLLREYYFLDNDVIIIRDMHCTYNGVGSLTRDDSRGIALIEYDDMKLSH